MHESSRDEAEPRLADPTISLEELTELKVAAGVPVDEYGRGVAKDIEDLQKEPVEKER